MCRVVTARRWQLFPEPVAALDQRFTEIFVMTFFGMNSVRFPFIRVGEREAVRAPFGEQKNKKRRREDATDISAGYRFAIAPHDNASLTILRLVEQEWGLQWVSLNKI